MLLLNGINDNIIIPRLYYSGVYQDKAKKELLQKINIFGVGTKPKKTDKTVVQISPSILGLKNPPQHAI